MKKIVCDIWCPFTKDVEEKWKMLKNKIESWSELGVSLAERKEIMTAMNLGHGHWYQCPNGHVYAIGECGGAMQVP